MTMAKELKDELLTELEDKLSVNLESFKKIFSIDSEAELKPFNGGSLTEVEEKLLAELKANKNILETEKVRKFMTELDNNTSETELVEETEQGKVVLGNYKDAGVQRELFDKASLQKEVDVALAAAGLSLIRTDTILKR